MVVESLLVATNGAKAGKAQLRQERHNAFLYWRANPGICNQRILLAHTAIAIGRTDANLKFFENIFARDQRRLKIEELR